MCFSGTSITSGKATGIVVAVGQNSEIGKIAKILSSSIKEKTPLEKEIDKIGKILTIGVLAIVFVVFIAKLFLNQNSTFLDGQSAAFGSVLEGMDVVDKIVKSRVITRSPYGGGKDRPVEPPVMKKVTVETFGEEYAEPNKLEK